MAKATIKVYGKATRNGYVEVISAEQYEEKVSARAKEFYENEQDFFDWLEDHFSVGEIWDMTDETKKTVREKEYKERCGMWALDDMEGEYEDFEITTEVECGCECHKED